MEKSRKNIEDGEKKNIKQVDKCQKQLDADVKDKEIIKEAAKKMRGKGTLEGMDKVAKLGDKAAGKVDDKTKKDNSELDKTAHKDAENREKDLNKRAGETKSDSKDLKNASKSLDQKGATSQMENAAKEAADDRKHLEKSEKSQKKVREKSQREAIKKGTKVKRTKPNFKRR